MSEHGPTRIVIVDDEPAVRFGIRDFLEDRPDCRIVGEAEDGPRALEIIREQNPELLLLDIQIPELDGFGVLDALQDHERPLTVFVTAYERYAIRAFEAHALDYLVKPFDRERFYRCLDHAQEHLGVRVGFQSGLRELIRDLRGERDHLERLVARKKHRIHLVPTEEVTVIDAAGNYVKVHTSEDEFLIRDSIGKLIEQLDPLRFVRIHRSTVVALSAIKTLERLPGGDFHVRLHDGQERTLTRGYRAMFESVLGRSL